MCFAKKVRRVMKRWVRRFPGIVVARATRDRFYDVTSNASATSQDLPGTVETFVFLLGP